MDVKAKEPSPKAEWTGRAVIEHLAEIYQQLYLRPGPAGEAAYKDIVNRGKDAEIRDLSHFRSHQMDRCDHEMTPAGPIMVITLHERADFELFLQIIAHRCVPFAVPATQGASIIDGVVNWQRIRAHKAGFLLAQRLAGDLDPDWAAEFRRFTADKANYKDALIVLSCGPYSNLPTSKVNLDEQAWLEASMTIRRVHECTHFICRRMYPDQIDAVWDELVADAAGIYAAFGHFDLPLAELCLGVTAEGFTEGRLRNYADESALDELARRIHTVFTAFDAILKALGDVSPFDAALALEEQKPLLWDGGKAE